MARSFPGTNGNYLGGIGDAPALDITGNYLTLAAWVNKASNGNRWVVAKENAAPTASQYRLTISGGVEMMVCDATGGDSVSGATSVPLGTWHHVAGVKDGTGAGALRVYIDGRLDGHGTSNKSIQNTPRHFTIGNREANDTPMDGLIAHAAVWPVALTPNEILELARGLSPLYVQPRQLAGYWPLDDYVSGGNSMDRSQYNNVAGIVGAVPLTVDTPVDYLRIHVTTLVVQPNLVGAQLFAGGVISG